MPVTEEDPADRSDSGQQVGQDGKVFQAPDPACGKRSAAAEDHRQPGPQNDHGNEYIEYGFEYTLHDFSIHFCCTIVFYICPGFGELII